jgi:hypothetical protein
MTNIIQEEETRTSAAGSLSSIWQRLQPGFTSWKMAIPAATLAAWGDYYALGRWTVLVWALAKAEQNVQDWRPHQLILDRLLANLKQRLPLEEEAKRAVAALERIQALLVAVQRQANEQVRAELSRGLEITMQQLVP